MRRVYLQRRDLHLYIGLFISPFILVFAVSVFVLLHGGRSAGGAEPPGDVRTVTGVRLPPGSASLEGRARIEALRPVLMLLSSYVMWYQLPAKRRGGIVALLAGIVSCGVFVVGVRWLA